VSLLLAAATGVTNVAYNTQNQTLLQVLAPRHLRGRVMSIRALERGLVPFATLLAGALAAALGAPSAVRIMSAVGLATVALVVLTAPSILRLKVSLSDEVRSGYSRHRGGAAGGALPPGVPGDLTPATSPGER